MKKGFTLIEMIIALSLLLSVLLLSYSIYQFGIRGYVDSVDEIENQSNVRISLEHITYNLRRDKDIKINGDTLVVGSESYRLAGKILMNKDNQLAVGISEFIFTKVSPSLVYVEISSIPDERGKSFTLGAYIHTIN